MWIDIDYGEDALARARAAASRHCTSRGHAYDDAEFPIEAAQTRRYPSIDLEALRSDDRSGVYLIREEQRRRGYVGIATSLGKRFYNGKSDCKTNCPPTCGCFGHINATPRTCRSHRIIESGRPFHVSLLQEMTYDPVSISQAEVDWYYLLREHGFEMVNADWALGVAGFTGRPVVSFDIDADRYHHFPTISDAAQRLLPDHSGKAGAVGPMVSGFQNQLGGFTHRYATEEEVEAWRGERDVDASIRSLPTDVRWTDGRRRNSKLIWTAGPLATADVAHLRKYRRGTYKKSAIPTSAYKGVSWCVTRWQCRAQSGPSSKNLWQTNRKAWVEDDATAAARFREEKILREGWEAYNTGPAKGSNARLLNEALGTDFVDWEEPASKDPSGSGR